MCFEDEIDFGTDVAVHKTPRQEGDVMSSLLVGLYDAHRSYIQHEHHDTEFKDHLCQQMTELLSVSKRISDKEMITDLLVSLIKQSERDLKSAIAERLSGMDNIPLRLVLQLVNDEIDVAKPVLQKSPVLNDLDLLYIIQSRDSSFWQAIASRRALDDNVVDALADTHDVPTARVLIDNDTISFSEYASAVIGEMAVHDTSLAEPLLMRSDVPEDMARKLYNYVGDELRKTIASRYQFEAPEISDVVNEVIHEFTVEPDKASPLVPSSAMVRAADLFMRQGKLTPALMLKTLKRGQIASFVAQLSVFVGLPVAVIVPMLRQKTGQGLAIAARAHGLSKDEYISIFMLSRKFISDEARVNSTYVHRAIEYYDRISPELARKLLQRSQN